MSDADVQAIVQRVVERLVTEVQPQHPSNNALPESNLQKKLIVAIGADHGGFGLKESLKPFIVDSGYEVIDCGTNDKNPVDYPDFAVAVARLIVSGKAWRGIMIDGAGIGSCMTANKVPGIRAAMCYDHATAVNSREHNNANMLTLGAGLIGENLAQQIVKTFLSTDFLGGRHTRRVDKIEAIEKEYLGSGH
ncbi:MAG: ribose 5-phosphate isomerase B [Anaerolineaceae bacterium]|nr:ribose 5-phosphate isomerase B [Anaerolineaceae bacterium]